MLSMIHFKKKRELYDFNILYFLQALFNGISGLKYRMPGTPRIWRSLILEQDVFYPPEDGWGERIYLSSFPAGSIYYL